MKMHRSTAFTSSIARWLALAALLFAGAAMAQQQAVVANTTATAEVSNK